ncbi:60S ribosomal protein L11 [Rhizophlyctis rosea]|nr:60S ribosomal protein L11 [Rhizophlyctis rosea]
MTKSPPARPSTATHGNSTVTWHHDFHFPAIRDEFNNSLNGNGEPIVLRTEPFGSEGSQWRLKFNLKRASNLQKSNLSAWIVEEKSEKEVNMGDEWFRVVYWSTIILKDPQNHQHDHVSSLPDKGIVDSVGSGRKWGWLHFAQVNHFQPYFHPDGSIHGTVSLKWERAPCDNQPVPPLRVTDLHAHKVVFATRSPYFKGIFSSGLSESTSSSTGPTVILVRDFSRPTVESLLEFIYTNKLTRNPPQNLEGRFELIRAADYYLMEDLHILVAEQIVEKHLDMHTALEILFKANKCKGVCRVLSDKVMEFLQEGWKEFTKSKDFLDSTRRYGPDLVADLYE